MIDWTIAGPLIDQLVSEEATSVTVCSDNVDNNALPNCAILAANRATNYEERFYRGDTIIDCLEAAIAELYPSGPPVVTFYESNPGGSAKVEDLFGISAAPSKDDWMDLL